jgi:hypothetical protein
MTGRCHGSRQVTDEEDDCPWMSELVRVDDTGEEVDNETFALKSLMTMHKKPRRGHGK